MNYMLLIAQLGFILVTLIYFVLFLREFRTAALQSSLSDALKPRLLNRLLKCLIWWTILISTWSLYGKMADFSQFPFNVGLVVLPPLAAALILTFSKSTGPVLRRMPAERLLYLQSFRVAVELLLWALFAAGALPVQMTFEGRNFDILTGLTAPIAGYLFARGKLGRTALIVWNIAGLALLVNIVAVAILSMPTPLRVFMSEPANTIVTHFPVSWLPGLLVPLAYTLHFLSLRQLLQKR